MNKYFNNIPGIKNSKIVYKYSCHSDSLYVGRTSQRLEERTRHVPKFIRNKIKPQKDLPRRQCKFTQNTLISDLAIGQHLSDNKICAEKLNIKWFSILATGRSSGNAQSHFHRVS